MKVKAIADGYYDDEFIKKGRVFNIKGDNVPKWCTLANGIETRAKDEKVEEPQTPAVPANAEGNAPAGVNEGVNEGNEVPEVKEPEKENAPEDEEISPEVVSYLNRLIDEGVEKGVLIEDTDKKSIKEQIAELEMRLGKGNKQLCV